MKKLLFILGAIGFITFSASCGKCGSCSISLGITEEICVGKDGWTQTNYDSYKLACTNNGGTFTEK